MPRDRRYNVHILVARDEDQYSALCYEYTTVGCGPTVREAVEDCVYATIDYMEYFIGEGREREAGRRASSQLILEFLDLGAEDDPTVERMEDALGTVVLAAATLERKLEFKYDAQHRRLSLDFPPSPLPSLIDQPTNYPAELVFAE